MDSVGFFWFQNFSTTAVVITAAMRISSTTPTTELTMITRKFSEIDIKCCDVLFLCLYLELYRSTESKKNSVCGNKPAKIDDSNPVCLLTTV